MSDTALHVDPDDLTIGDLEDFKSVAGVSIQKAFPKPAPPKDGEEPEEPDVDPTALKALIWIVKRKENPEFSLADARNVKITELHIGADPSDPTPAADAQS